MCVWGGGGGGGGECVSERCVSLSVKKMPLFLGCCSNPLLYVFPPLSWSGAVQSHHKRVSVYLCVCNLHFSVIYST